jgi:hypothetical protein
LLDLAGSCGYGLPNTEMLTVLRFHLVPRFASVGRSLLHEKGKKRATLPLTLASLIPVEAGIRAAHLTDECDHKTRSHTPETTERTASADAR